LLVLLPAWIIISELLNSSLDGIYIGSIEHFTLFQTLVSNIYQHFVRLYTIVLFLRLFVPAVLFVYTYYC
jgi:hypothetical protein